MAARVIIQIEEPTFQDASRRVNVESVFDDTCPADWYGDGCHLGLRLVKHPLSIEREQRGHFFKPVHFLLSVNVRIPQRTPSDIRQTASQGRKHLETVWIQEPREDG